MEDSSNLNLPDKRASNVVRLAGAMFILVCIPMSLWSQMYVPSKVFVPQDPAATAANMLSHEFIFRTSILFNILGPAVFAIMMLMFYSVFRHVHRYLSLCMIVFVFVQVPIIFVLEIFNFAALLIVDSDPRPGFDVVQQQETAYLLMRVSRAGISCEKLFFGVSFIPWGIIVWRSGFVPKIFGVLLILSGIGYILDTSAGILLERPIVVMIRPYLRGMFGGFMLTVLWFIFKGLQYEKRSTQRAAAIV